MWVFGLHCVEDDLPLLTACRGLQGADLALL